MALITDYVAFKMRERLTLESVFYEVKGYFEIPFSFTDCRFLYKHKYGTGYVNLKDLLKEWVSYMHQVFFCLILDKKSFILSRG